MRGVIENDVSRSGTLALVILLPCEPGRTGSPYSDVAIGGTMKFAEQSICKGCQREMEQVATILPMGGNPGLVAFLCAQCGKSESMLVYPIRHAGQSRQREYEAHISPSRAAVGQYQN
jgi:hypothetical protein